MASELAELTPTVYPVKCDYIDSALLFHIQTSTLFIHVLSTNVCLFTALILITIEHIGDLPV